MLFRIISVTTAVAMLTAASLPETGPMPQPKPDSEQTQAPSDLPIPAQKPEASETEPPSDLPVPAPKPEASETEPPAKEMQGPPKPPLTIAAESDEEHQACLGELSAMGAVFKDIPRIDDGNGCGIDKPIALSEPLPGIKMKPEGTLRCEAALALAHWMKESVIPAAAIALKDNGRITEINQASTYICRLRNNATTGKISEHARGNAIDIASFTFENGKIVGIEPRHEDPTLTGAFQRSASASACLYFRTVLDPDSDAAHETHFHLDVLKRNGEFRYCH
ncbi:MULTISPECIES: extensin family protein [unclassified Rhizobium]|uniref:extensin family protein n=1 Tax=unclassified Rhizobium TaxID=2613769 RepID=UPI000CF1FA57|nr:MULTISPECIES: extensin family protein [Rhizobium]UWU19796.1 extensin family protein [Rhizobium tropici]